MAHKAWWPSHSCVLHQALSLSWYLPRIPILPGRPLMSARQAQGDQSPQPKCQPVWFSISPSILLCAMCPDSFLSSFLLPCPFLSSSSSWTMKVEWQCKSKSLLENPSRGGSVSPIFMSFKWLLSKWGRTKSRLNCHKYKWLDIGCNKPSGKMIWCAVAVMVYHTGSSYISAGKVIRSFQRTLMGEKRQWVGVNHTRGGTVIHLISGCWYFKEPACS